jgi:hypothetical protein
MRCELYLCKQFYTFLFCKSFPEFGTKLDICSLLHDSKEKQLKHGAPEAEMIQLEIFFHYFLLAIT